MIIDFHTHTFPEKISEKVVNNLAKESCTKPFTNGSISGLLSSMKEAGLDYSVNLPVMTSPEQVEKLNSSFIQAKEELFLKGIIAFGGMHPDYAPDKIREELLRLKSAGIQGIKIHPAYQKYDLDHPKMMKIIDIASELDMIVITHAGIDIGIYDHDYASVKHVLKILKEIAPPKLVLAHMGGWGCWEDVERDLAGAPVYFDTAFSIGAITPLPGHDKRPYLEENMSVENFSRMAKKHGCDKILFATDSPWQEQKDVVKLVTQSNLSDREKMLIFEKNALHLLKLHK
ncbi:MAG: amidohydrolase family protein [Lachnospiraceae bacterium]|nr:amidohydrolase family protein [Lachnospiraceae bacterium]